MKRRSIEEILNTFLDRVLKELITKPEVQGRWILYIPSEDRYEIFNTRDEAVKYVYKKLTGVDIVILLQVPLSSEESYIAFTKMLTSSHR
ncbi:MAG: hypothetical protein GXO10_03335 [Crenarchaeota archaeon]|nr:hypothetical protein [Thermoproteota archaeon]